MSGPPRVLAPCPERETISRLVSLRERDGLDAAGGALLSRHLASCPSCFAAAVSADPALLFARLAASVEADELAARAAQRPSRASRDEAAEAEILAADVLAAIRVRAAETGVRGRRLPAGLRPWLRAAAVLFLASGLAAVLVLSRPAGPAAPPRPEDVATAPAGPLIEELASPGARVYEFAASKPGEPAVVFVANPDAEL